MSQFDFLKTEWPPVHAAAAQAERVAHADSRTACFYARRALELAVHWAYKYDGSLRLPYQENISALLHEPTFKRTAGEAVFTKAKVIVTLGNRAVHGVKPVSMDDGVVAVRELFHILYWLARTYGRQSKPAPDLRFNPAVLPKEAPLPPRAVEQIRRLEEELRAKDEKLAAFSADTYMLYPGLEQARAEVAAAKTVAMALPDTHDYSEAETRDYFIDLLLKESGWALDQPRDREYEVSGMPNTQNKGFVDYVLWGDDGRPLAVVEAKRSRRDPRVGQQQAKLYADCLEQQFGRRPVMFYSNGYEHWLWDDTRYPPRQMQGFYTRDELELLLQRRESRKPLAEASINDAIVERPYQMRAIRRVAEAFEQDHERKALLVMATGSGKTRTTIALCDLLMRCNWVKRVLFLADRVALVNQAAREFNKHLPSCPTVNLVTNRDGEGRVFFSTYPTMMGLINESKDGMRRFGPGYFDLIVIDEAHRSVFQKYRAIFDYFDALLVGLTATPKDDVDRNTYGLFDLENGVPTDAYSLDEAVRDQYLVPPKAISVPLKFQRQGIKYDELSDDEKDQWDTLDWDDEGGVPPDRVEAEAVNRWLFNIDTVDKVLAYLMTHGLKVAGGERIGKTIIFAKNQDHADFIAERFDKNYPQYRGAFARVITFKTEYAQSLIDAFSNPDKEPHIAISVDMLDTGIDVPEVVNLLFFKLIRSKAKFWQMLGRGTRLRPELFGPGKHKPFFYLFDYCQNLEYFSQNLPPVEAPVADSLGTRLFKVRLELVGALDTKEAVADEGEAYGGEPQTNAQVRQTLVSRLREEVSAMNLDNFIVRPKRRWVEKYQTTEPWQRLDRESIAEMASELADLPNELPAENEEAKRFDLMLLRLQLGLFVPEPGYERLREKVQDLAAALLEYDSIPAVREQMALIDQVAGEDWWQDVTLPMLELARLRLRSLIGLIEKGKRRVVYSDFVDEISQGSEVELPGFALDNFARFRAKARAFLRGHLDHVAIQKLRRNRPLTATDLLELERMLLDNGIGTAEDIAQAKQEAHGLGLFIRSLVGLERETVRAALEGFVQGRTFTANQLEFISMLIEHLAEHGVIDAGRLYESPFIDLAPAGPEALFGDAATDALLQTIETAIRNADAA